MGKSKKYDKIAQISAQSVKKATEKDWATWIEILEQAGVRQWSHQEIVALLAKKYKLSLWWRQWVAIGYEIAVGKRVEGQNLKGQYSTTSTKSLDIEAKKIWNFICSPEGLKIWLKPLSEFELKPGHSYECLGEVFGEVRTVKPGSRARLTWQEIEWSKPTIVQILVVPRPKRKSILAIQHENILDSRTKSRMAQHWRRALTDVKIALTQTTLRLQQN